MEKFNSNNSVSFDVYNMNRTSKLIDIFSLEKEEHTGIIKIVDNPDFFDRKNCSVGLIRLRFDSSYLKNYSTDYFLLDGKKYMFANYFSPYQYQDNIIDIVLNKDISENFSFKVNVPSRKILNASVYLGTDSVINQPIPDSQLMFIIKNRTGLELKDVDILGKIFTWVLSNITDSESPCKYKDDKIEIHCPVNDFNSFEKFNRLRIISKNSSQLCQPVSYDGVVINTFMYMSAVQTQAGIIDVDMNFTKPSSILYTILPHEQAILYFTNYKVIDDNTVPLTYPIYLNK